MTASPEQAIVRHPGLPLLHVRRMSSLETGVQTSSAKQYSWTVLSGLSEGLSGMPLEHLAWKCTHAHLRLMLKGFHNRWV